MKTRSEIAKNGKRRFLVIGNIPKLHKCDKCKNGYLDPITKELCDNCNGVGYKYGRLRKWRYYANKADAKAENPGCEVVHA